MTGVAVVAGALFGLLWTVRRSVFLARVDGSSMTPTYADGDVLVAVRLRRRLAGRAAVFRPPGPHADLPGPRYRVKRVAAVAGQPTPDWVRGEPAGLPVPAGKLVVRGDADASADSRTYGFVDRRAVLGVVVCRLTGNRRRLGP